MPRTLNFTILVIGIMAISPMAHAGGPLLTLNGRAVVYPDSNFPILYNPDQGSLGSFNNAEATALVESSFQPWQDVPTATITFENDEQLPVDVDADNYASYLNNFNDGINPIIFDSDGLIIEAEFGKGSSLQVIGFAGSAYNTATGYYAEGMAVLNGLFSSVFTLEQFKATFVHEFGHFFGLDHTQLNLQYVRDGNTANDQYVPTMYPTSTDDDTTLGDLNPDDKAAITLLYPADNYTASYGRITGKVNWSGGGPVLGANVVAIKTADGDLNQFSSVSDYYMLGDGTYEMLVTPGAYSILIEPISPEFTAGSGVGPYSENLNRPSFTNPVLKQFYSSLVTVAAGQTVSDIDFIAEEGSSTTTTVSSSATTVPSTTTTVLATTTTVPVSTTTLPSTTTTIYSGGCPQDSPIDCGNDYCCPIDLPYCGSGFKTGQCFATPPGPCAATMLLGEGSEEINLIRDFRDELLAGSRTGRDLIRLYYKHSSELRTIIMQEPAIRKKARKALSAIMPVLSAALEEMPGEITVNTDTAATINDLCLRISQKADPEFRDVIKLLLFDFNRGTLLKRITP